MTVNYTFDPDLDIVLQNASNQDLEPLVELITTAGSKTEQLSSSEEYQRFYPDHRRYMHVISHEIRAFGGHSVANFFRFGKGPDYRTIVIDVAKHLKVQYDPKAKVEIIERQILAHLMHDLYGQMTPMQQQLFVKEVEQLQPEGSTALVPLEKTNDLSELSPMARLFVSIVAVTSFTKSPVVRKFVSATEDVVEQSARKFASFVADSAVWVGDQVSSAFDAVVNIGGPSFNMTVPCVMHVSMIRLRQNMAKGFSDATDVVFKGSDLTSGADAFKG